MKKELVHIYEGTEKSISSYIARYSAVNRRIPRFSFGTVTLLLFSEAFRSLSAGSRLSRFPAGVERCFSKQRNVSTYYFSHAGPYNKSIHVQVVPLMISNQETLYLSPYMAIYDIIVDATHTKARYNQKSPKVILHGK